MRYVIVVSSLILVLTVSASGDTYVVNPDGTGDYPTIQAAINAVGTGDIIELTDGIFTGGGNRGIDFLGKAITVRSQSGNPEACIIDCQQADRGFLFSSNEGPESVLEGVTVRNGSAGNYGGAVYCSVGSPTITNCVFSDNWGAQHAGAMLCFGGSAPTVEGCVFQGNATNLCGGGLLCWESSSPTLNGCTFAGNSANAAGGGIFCSDSSIPIITSCTFWGNATNGAGAGVCYEEGPLALENCIIAFSTNGNAVDGDDPDTLALTCCDIYGNADGPGAAVEWIGLSGNIAEDPLFCDAENADFSIRSDSPCAPESNPLCGLIGAWPVGCCFGDLDGDGDVDLTDLAQLLAHYGMTEGATYEDGDLDGDDDVDLSDLAALLAVYGTSCS
jgi:predicted outer membrane repeat protein